MLFLTVTTLVHGQDVEDGAIEEVPSDIQQEESPQKRSSDRRNWIFAAGSAVAAAIAIVIVALNPGESPPSGSAQ